MADDAGSVISVDVLNQEHGELLNKIAELQQNKWMLEEKVRVQYRNLPSKHPQ